MKYIAIGLFVAVILLKAFGQDEPPQYPDPQPDPPDTSWSPYQP